MSDGVDRDEAASGQFNLEAGMDFDVTAADAHSLASDLEDAEAAPTDDTSTQALAEWVDSLKRLEDAAEAARKEVFETALDERVDTGESVGPLQRVEGANSYVTDAEGAFAAVADAGEDPLSVASVKVGALRDAIGARADDYVGQSKYTFYRRDA